MQAKPKDLANVHNRFLKIRRWYHDFLVDGVPTENVEQLLSDAKAILGADTVSSEQVATLNRILDEAELVFTRARYKNNLAVIDEGVKLASAKLEAQQQSASAENQETEQHLAVARQKRAEATRLAAQDKWEDAFSELSEAHQHLKQIIEPS